MTAQEYAEIMGARYAIACRNSARRMRGLPTEKLPPKPPQPKVRIAYEPDGTYIGRCESADEVPAGAVVRWEPALW